MMLEKSFMFGFPINSLYIRTTFRTIFPIHLHPLHGTKQRMKMDEIDKAIAWAFDVDVTENAERPVDDGRGRGVVNSLGLDAFRFLDSPNHPQIRMDVPPPPPPQQQEQEQQQQQLVPPDAVDGTVIPTDQDVLGGKGGGSNNHPGNIRFRQEAMVVKPWYISERDCRKNFWARMLLYTIQYEIGGRFLKKVPGGYTVMPNKEALKKCCQLLREGDNTAARLEGDRMRNSLR